MLKPSVMRMSLLAVLAVIAVAGVLVFRAIDTGPSASAAPGTQEEQNQETAWLGANVVLAADGVTVASVIADSPADTAGLQRGDVVTAVDGTTIGTLQDFRDLLKDKAVGDTITLTINRDGQALDVTATLEAQPEALAPAIPLLPELEGIAADELFSHVQGGQFNFTDEQGNLLTLTVDAGTVASVDTGTGTLTLNLNAGGTKTYTVEDGDMGVALSDLQQGDEVAVMSVGNDVRVVVRGVGMLLPGFGGGHGCGRGDGGHMGPPGGWDGGTVMPEEAPDAGPDAGL
jgi:membrane-associated protease RseP (regulator of RpoE activity)